MNSLHSMKIPAPLFHVGDSVIFRNGNIVLLGTVSDGWLNMEHDTPMWNYAVDVDGKRYMWFYASQLCKSSDHNANQESLLLLI